MVADPVRFPIMLVSLVVLAVVVLLVTRLLLATQRVGLEAQATSVVYPQQKAVLAEQATSGRRAPTQRSAQVAAVVAQGP